MSATQVYDSNVFVRVRPSMGFLIAEFCDMPHSYILTASVSHKFRLSWPKVTFLRYVGNCYILSVAHGKTINEFFSHKIDDS
jgi:hypothetical protein